MPSNVFNSPRAKPKPPAYCHYEPDPWPIVLPLFPKPILHGYARWTDLDPLAPIDIAAYFPMIQLGAAWTWQGIITKALVTFRLTLDRTDDPQPWTVALMVWDPWRDPESMSWDPVQLQLQPQWDTGWLTHVTLPGYDFREARVQQ